SDGGRDLGRDDIREMLKIAIDVIVQCKRIDGRFRVTEIYYRAATGTRIVDAARSARRNC
ncbi:P-type DNA transfer ATPase VirB11, partial [Rhizobium leguminosarum]|nr:P-type DNA transfer ATPase VirB11 [Rhizobium leguminosarum]